MTAPFLYHTIVIKGTLRLDGKEVLEMIQGTVGMRQNGKTSRAHLNSSGYACVWRNSFPINLNSLQVSLKIVARVSHIALNEVNGGRYVVVVL